MRNLKASLCSRCGAHHTSRETGICSRCRHKPEPERPCIICGATSTNHPSGICSSCRQHECRDLPTAIGAQRRVLRILELREGGQTFRDIAKSVGMSTTATFETYRRALRLPNWAISMDL